MRSLTSGRRARRCAAKLLLLAVVPFFAPVTAVAELTRIELTKREPWSGGREFGERGAYQRLRGKAWFEVDPGAPANRTVVDLALAPKNKAGRVEFAADVEIIAPADLSRSSGAIFYDVNNRGHPTCLGTISSGGDQFLMREGFILVFSGWIAELLPDGKKLVLEAPVASDRGKAIRGLVRAEIVVSQKTARSSLSGNSGHGSYEPTARGEKEAILTRRLREKDARVVVARSNWKFEKSWPVFQDAKSAMPKIELVLEGGFEPGVIYELVYEAKNPVVQGLGMAGIRDLISYLKHSRDRGNPLLLASGSPAARYAYGFGTSQSGRLLRMLLYDGFNADEKGRKVFDAVMPHVAGGGLGFFNHRFASPTRYSTQHESHLYPTDYFPFSYGEQKDHLSGRTDGILRRARAAGVVPRVLHTQSSSEYWHRSASLVHTDTTGGKDVALPSEVRIYTFGGSQHGPGNGMPRPRSRGQLPSNPINFRPLLRALVKAMDAWVRDGTEPPPSAYPTIASGSLVPWEAAESGWTPLPGVAYPKVIQQPALLDRGPHFTAERRTTVQPPRVGAAYKVLVPGYGSDNNEKGCLLLPSVAVPVATLTSWNLRDKSIGAPGELLSLQGGHIPLLRDRNARTAAKDPRLSLLERYRGFELYLEQYLAWARKLVKERYLLEEDLPSIDKGSWDREKLFE